MSRKPKAPPALMIDGYTCTWGEQWLLHTLGVPADEVWVHAPHLPVSTFRLDLENAGKIIMVNTAPCKSCGTTIRTRSGHCLGHGTTPTIFKRRYATAYVYLAYSARKGLAKFGLARDIARRLAEINSTAAYAYAGVSDWEIMRHREVSEAGMVEAQLHDKIGALPVAVAYRGGKYTAREAYEVSRKRALETWHAVVGPD